MNKKYTNKKIQKVDKNLTLTRNRLLEQRNRWNESQKELMKKLEVE